MDGNEFGFHNDWMDCTQFAEIDEGRMTELVMHSHFLD